MIVSGNHQYWAAGVYNLTVTVSRSGTSLVFTLQLVIADASLTGSSASISGSAGSALSSTSVGTFTDGNSLATTSAFAATIYWGDGATSAGTITLSSGIFTVHGSHTYSYAGTYQVTASVLDHGGTSATITSTATITGNFSVTPLSLTGTTGTATGTIPVAYFTTGDYGPFTASIDWGDGHQSTGSVSMNDSGGYTVTGNNTYTQGGTYQVTVTLFDNGTQVGVVVSSANISVSALTGSGLPLSFTQGVPFANVTLARFTGAGAFPPGAYIATIDWGYGSDVESGSDSAGLVVPEGNGTFAVQGGYTYRRPGSYPVTVSVSGPDGSASVTATATVTAAAPQVTAVSPTWGPTQGGNPVTISGLNLFGASAVTFGSTAATAFTVNDDGTITAIAPALSSGTVDVTVTTSAGTSSTSAADKYTATAGAAPTVTGLSSSSGPTGGGNNVTVTGTNLASAVGVSFGSDPADFTVLSDTSISVTVPAQLASTVHVTVTSPYGTSATSSADQYTYSGTAPTVTGLDVTQGPAAGGTLLTVLGSNFNGTSSVSFGSTSTTAFTVLSSTSLLVTVPSLTAGTCHVTVTNPYGTYSTSSADQLTAVDAPAVTSLGTTSGPTGGGTSVAISGSGFTDAWQVLFGGVPASFTINSSTSITATAPASDSRHGRRHRPRLGRLLRRRLR